MAVAVILGLWAATAAGAGAAPPISLTVDAQPAVAAVGEPIEILVTKCNETASEVTIVQPCPGCGIRVTIENAADEEVTQAPVGGIQVVVFITWQPGECKTETYTWDQDSPWSYGEQVAPGTYTVRYEWEGGGPPTLSATDSFEIRAVDVPFLSPAGLAILAVLLALCGAAVSARGRVG